MTDQPKPHSTVTPSVSTSGTFPLVIAADLSDSMSRAGLANDARLIHRNQTHPGLVDLSLLPRPVQRLGIVGCGLMGRSIAALAVGQGIPVTMIDAAEPALDLARETFSGDSCVTVTSQYAPLAEADLIIEAVVETLPVKKMVHQRIESSAATHATIASNTSSIPLSSMEHHFKSHERFCGIHFCHPEVMSLVEVIAGPSTSPQTTANAVGFVRQLEKMPIAIKDCAGFVVNRLLSAMLNQSLRLLGSGIPVAEIDAAMRAFGFKAGPFEIIDIIGADTCMYAGRTMWEHKLECVSLSPILPRLVKLGRLGRKTGAGFYCYPDPRGDAVDDPELQTLIAPYVKFEKVPQPPTPRGIRALALKILAPVVLEATRILEQSIVDDFRDIDLAFTHGLSFPQQRGGLLYWADQIGIKDLLDILESLAIDDPAHTPTALLNSMASHGTRFYN